MATGDVLSCSINANGLLATVRLEGMNTGGDYNFGPLWDDPLDDYGKTSANDPASATMVFTVTSEGYDATGTLGTTSRTIYGVPHQDSTPGGGVGCMRKAWVGASDPVPDETAVVSDIDIVVILSEPIYDDDTSITVTISAAWYDDASNTSNATTDLSVTNNSTLDYPEPVAQWDTVVGAFTADMLKANFKLACNAYAKHGIACVIFDADGVTSSNNETETVTSKTATQRTGSGLYAEAYQTADLTIANFTQGETINGRFRIYPKVGDANSVIDSNSFTTATDLGLMRNKLVMLCDKDDSSDTVKYVAASGGTDDTNPGRGDSAGDPYATISYAIGQGATVVNLNAGSHTSAVDPGARVANTEWIIIQPAPGEDETSVDWTMPSSNVTTDRQFLQFKGITIKRTDANSRFSCSAEDNIRITDCTFDRNAISASSNPIGFNAPLCLLENCVGDLGEWLCQIFSGTTTILHAVDGCLCDSSATALLWHPTRMVACDCTDLRLGQGNDAVHVHDNCIIAFNKNMNHSSSSALTFNEHNVTAGWAVVGNVFETASGTSQTVTFSNNIDNENTLFIHNTAVGERCSFHYNDNGSVAEQGNGTLLANNHLKVIGSKHDDFGTQDANRIGQWESMVACGHFGNCTASETGSFPQQFTGLWSRLDTSQTWADDNSATGDGTGNGDYRDANSTTSEYTASTERLVDIDLTGRTRPNAGVVYRGALLPVPNAPSTLVEA